MGKILEPDDLVTVTKERLAELESMEDFLSALEAAGVDNWEGYGEACVRFDSGDF